MSVAKLGIQLTGESSYNSARKNCNNKFTARLWSQLEGSVNKGEGDNGGRRSRRVSHQNILLKIRALVSFAGIKNDFSW